MVDNIIYSKFPNPPKFNNPPNKEVFEVPKYYGFDHPCTKWILGSIVSNQALLRLLKVAAVHQAVMKRYHQIPDRPGLIMKNSFSNERAAFNNQAILYLTPLAIAIYMKYEDGLSQLVSLKDAEGKCIVDPNDRCFVQNFWRKGESRYFTDLITTFPAIVAIRRNYVDAFQYLLTAGYSPNRSFSLTYRKPHREIVIVYKDIIDYVIDYLKSRPAFNVSRLMHVLLQTTNDHGNILDIFCFDFIPTSKPDVVSLFLRVAHMALDDDNVSEENGMHIINVLEKIQEAGYFHGLPVTSSKSQTTTKTIKDITGEDKNGKIKLSDLQTLSVEERNSLIEGDYKQCISTVIMWLRTRSLKRKTEQNIHLLNLLTKILFDTKHIELFFKTESKSVKELMKKLDEVFTIPSRLDEKTAVVIRDHIVQVYNQSETMIYSFVSRYQMEPNDAFLISPEQWDRLQCNTKSNWARNELADASFRKQYINDKERATKNNIIGEENDIYSEKDVQINPNLTNNNSGNQNNTLTENPKKGYFYIPTKPQKLRSNSMEMFCNKPYGGADKSYDVTVQTFQSFDSKNGSASFSLSSIADLDQLTMIEIDITNESRVIKKMYTEVVVNDDWDQRKESLNSNLSNEIVVPTTFEFSKFTTLVPPLKEHKKNVIT